MIDVFFICQHVSASTFLLMQKCFIKGILVYEIIIG